MILALDVGGTTVKISSIPNLEVQTYPTKKNIVQHLIHIIEQHLKDHKAIAIGFPGQVHHGVVRSAGNLPIKNIDLQKVLQHEFRKPVYIENDASCFTLFHAQEYEGSVVCGITLGTGIGIGLVTNGVIYRGAGYAPEIALIPWKQGVIEDYLSIRGLVRNSPYKLTPKELFERAKTDQKAQQVFELFGQELGVVLASVSRIYHPDIIMIGGNLSKSWKYMSGSIRSAFKANPHFPAKILWSRESYAGIKGAALLVP